jgi:hypothetical protein
MNEITLGIVLAIFSFWLIVGLLVSVNVFSEIKLNECKRSELFVLFLIIGPAWFVIVFLFFPSWVSKYIINRVNKNAYWKVPK